MSSERRSKEKITRKLFILDTAKSLLQAEGLSALTMRKLAEGIAYSPCILYETFPNKEALIVDLFSKICEELLVVMRAVQFSKDPKEYFRKLIWSDIHFMMQESYRIELFMIVSTRFTPKEFPPRMQEVVELIGSSLTQLGYQKLLDQKKRGEALDVLRTFLSGVLHMSLAQKTKERCKKILFNGLDTLLEGWKD